MSTPDAETPTTEDFQAAHIEALKNELTALRTAHEAAQAKLTAAEEKRKEAVKRCEQMCADEGAYLAKSSSGFAADERNQQGHQIKTAYTIARRIRAAFPDVWPREEGK